MGARGEKRQKFLSIRYLNITVDCLTHGLSLFFLLVEDGEFELCPHLTHVGDPCDQHQVEGEILPALFIKTTRVHTKTPARERERERER